MKKDRDQLFSLPNTGSDKEKKQDSTAEGIQLPSNFGLADNTNIEAEIGLVPFGVYFCGKDKKEYTYLGFMPEE
ncbi:hypothetical protein ELC62_29915, partial [Klebsiella pneumoniae]|nr:hypothetical protein [Klebsiella pneumoniae]